MTDSLHRQESHPVAFFSHSPRTHLIWANNYEPLPLDDRQFVPPVWFGAEAKWPHKAGLNTYICVNNFFVGIFHLL